MISSEQRPLRIAMVISNLGVGGAERQLVALVREFKKRGHEVAVLHMLPLDVLGAEIDATGAHRVSFDFSSTLRVPAIFARFSQELRQFSPDIVHCHMVHANLLGRFANLFGKRLPLICTAHSGVEGGRLRELLYRVTDPLCDLTTQVSQSGVDIYASKKMAPREKLRFIPNGIDLSKFERDEDIRKKMRASLGISDTHFCWIAVGRFHKVKEYPDMLRAFALLKADLPRARLIIAGQGDEFEPSKSLAQTLGIADEVMFLGPRDDVQYLYSAADAFVLSSSLEGLPMALLEAAASSLPAVATDIGGVTEILQDGEGGYVVPVNQPAVLGDRMADLMKLPHEQRVAMGRTGRARVQEKFGMDSVVSSWLGTYGKVISNHIRSAA